jgi:hypothetical protein
MKRALLVPVLGAAAAAAATTASAATRSGLHGHVCRAPASAPPAVTVCSPERLTFVLVGRGRRLTVRSAADGSYRVTLPSGVYRAQLPVHSGPNLRSLRPGLIRVTAGKDRRVDLYVQTRLAVDPAG